MSVTGEMTVSAGLGGYRLAFTETGGWRPVDDPSDLSGRDLEFPSMDTAWAAHSAALALWSDFISQRQQARAE